MGYARGQVAEEFGGDGPEGHIVNLTWAGHDFAAVARDENRWKKAMGIVAQKGGNVTLAIVTQILVRLATASIGLP